MGPRTTSTSAKVDRRAHVQRTCMVDHFQANVLDRTKKPSKQKRQHTCSICRGQGHHPQTCQQILSSENAERANLYFQQLIQKNKVQGYLDLLAKRTSQSFSRTVAERIQVVKARSRVFEGNEQRKMAVATVDCCFVFVFETKVELSWIISKVSGKDVKRRKRQNCKIICRKSMEQIR